MLGEQRDEDMHGTRDRPGVFGVGRARISLIDETPPVLDRREGSLADGGR